jgi:hypothetical protein
MCSNLTRETPQAIAQQEFATSPFICDATFAKVGNLGKLIRTYEFYAKTGDEFPQNARKSTVFA